MTREEAAVIKKYDLYENEMLYLTNKEIPVEKLNMETVSGCINLSKEAVKKTLDNLISKKTIFGKRSIDELLQMDGRLIRYVENPTKDQQLIAMVNHASLKDISAPCKEAVKYWLKNESRYNAPHLGYMQTDFEEFCMLGEEDIIEIVSETPAAMSGVPEKCCTKKIVYAFLEAMVKKNKPYLMSGFKNIPEIFRDRTFYLCFLMVHGYNLSLIPKEEVPQYISNNLINRVLSQSPWISPLWFYQYLPDQWKTASISIRFILSHPNCIVYLPSYLKDESFYEELLEESSKTGNFAWCCHIEEKISKSLFDKMVAAGVTEFPEKIPKSYFDELTYLKLLDKVAIKVPAGACTKKIAQKLAEQGLLEEIPKTMLTEDMIIEAFRKKKRNQISKLDPSLLTDNVIQRVWNEGLFTSLNDLPASYQTRECALDAIRRKIVTRITDIPRSILSPEIAEAIVLDNAFDFINNGKSYYFDIEKSLQTQKMCDCVMSIPQKGSFAWFYTLKKCDPKFRRKQDIDYAIENYSSAILLEDLSEEQILRSLELYPTNILEIGSVPTTEANTSNNQELGKSTLIQENVIIDWNSCSQLSLFDLMTEFSACI